MLEDRLRDIVAVANTVLARMARAHAVAGIVMKQAGEGECRAGRIGFTIDRRSSKAALNLLKQLPINQRLMLPSVGCASPDDLAEVEAVLQKVSQSANLNACPWRDRTPLR